MSSVIKARVVKSKLMYCTQRAQGNHCGDLPHGCGDLPHGCGDLPHGCFGLDLSENSIFLVLCHRKEEAMAPSANINDTERKADDVRHVLLLYCRRQCLDNNSEPNNQDSQ